MTHHRIALGLGLLAAVGCKAQKGVLDELFLCDPGAGDGQCGTTQAGKPMTCFAGSRLGGDDFCVERCDPSAPPADPGMKCLASGAAGALVSTCAPTGADAAAGCPKGLECYRTDLFLDEGVCLKMHVCSEDSDCGSNAKRPICAATIVRQLFAGMGNADHLQCLQAVCESEASQCQSGEACLANYFGAMPDLPDICVPKCDGSRECPPNFGCSQTATAPGAPSICLPGIPGARCQQSQDCLIGDCVDSGAGFGECTPPVPCATDLDCAAFDGPTSTFVCVGVAAGTRGHCIDLKAFDGPDCRDSTQCVGGLQCFWYSPYVVDQGHGECRVACDSAHPCPTRGGVPHVCLDSGQGGCYPSNFGLPCTTSSDCLAEFSCMAVAHDPRTLIDSPSICTFACVTDADCTGNPLIKKNGGFCSDDGVCRLSGQSGAPCDRDTQCLQQHCVLPPGAAGQCGAVGG